MLEELGVTWDKISISIPWENHYQSLFRYKEQFGHTDVPREWEENTELAQWVNIQREKFRDLKDGKENDLSDEQISWLNKIGFQWTVVGKGCYSADSPINEQASNVAGPTNPESLIELKTAAASYPNVAIGNETLLTSVTSYADKPNNLFPSEAQAAGMANVQQVRAQASETYNGIPISSAVPMPLNQHPNTNLYNDDFGAINRHNGLGSTNQHSILSQTFQSQQRLNQQLLQQHPSASAIGAHHPSMHAHQQFFVNQQPIQHSVHYGLWQGPQNGQPYHYQAYQEHLIQQMDESCQRNNESNSPPQDRKSC